MKKRVTKSTKLRATVDATRLAVASHERVLSVLARKGKKPEPPATAQEVADRERILRRPLPASYRAVVERSDGLGPGEKLLDAEAMVKKKKGIDDAALIPFCEGKDHELFCFDRKAEVEGGELPVHSWRAGKGQQVAKSFAAWLDSVADRMEDDLASAAEVPRSLRSLLGQLGFAFEDPIVGRLETGDVQAIEELIGSQLAAEVRGPHHRLFDTSGKASLTLNLDEFSLAVSLRTGIYVLPAEDVFRWLRWFRDENFFGEGPSSPSHPDRVRDLRRAPREPPLVLRGVLTVSALPSPRHTFRAASGVSARDFHLLGRTASTGPRGPSGGTGGTSLLLHVVNGVVQSAHAIDQPLSDIHVAADGAIWGLVAGHAGGAGGTAIRFTAAGARAFALPRPARGRTWFYGIGSAAGRLVAYGAGSLLQFDGTSFVPFQPNAHLEPEESVVALAGGTRDLAMLVCGEHVGAVARFDGRKWLPIEEGDVLDEAPVHMDVWRQTAMVLGRDGRMYRVESGGPPRPVPWDASHEAFRTEAGTARALYEVRGFDGGAILASDGGVIVVGAGDPVFYATPDSNDRAHLSRVGGGTGGPAARTAGDVAVTVCCGPHVWLWENGAMSVLDMRAW